MNRDIGNEVLVALAAIGVIAFALVFGILLSLSSNPSGGGSVRVQASATHVVTTEFIATAVSGVSLTEDVPVSVTPTDTPTPTFTATMLVLDVTVAPPTETDTATPTETLEATLTHTPTNTPTDSPTDSPTATPTDRPTDRPTDMPTMKPTDRPTQIASDTPTHTPTPSHTPTRTPSATRTPTYTPTQSATPTLTPFITETSGIFPTPTSPFTPTPQASVTAVGCVAPGGWTRYTVQPGNTLFSIALAVGSTVRELSRANCLNDADRILAGDVLFVPRQPLQPVRTFVPTTPVGIACSDIARITSPASGARVGGVVTVTGTADIPEFSFYKLEVRPDFAQIYNFYSESRTPVRNGTLGQLDTTIFGSGLHWLRLVVVDASASTPPEAICVIPLYFE